MRDVPGFLRSFYFLLSLGMFAEGFTCIKSRTNHQAPRIAVEFRNSCSLHHQKQTHNHQRQFELVTLLFEQGSASSSSLYLSPSSLSSSSSESIRFLGKGPDAIVRPGAVLLAPAEQQDHFLRQAALFVISMGENDAGDYLIRAVILDNPTPFTIGEMMPAKQTGGVYKNLIYRGGDTGSKNESDGCFCIHSFPHLGRDEIGTTGIYQGGDLTKMDNPDAVKFFFNFMEFTEQELEQLLEIKHDDGDAWTSVEIPKNLILSNYDRGDAWSRLRNAVRNQIR